MGQKLIQKYFSKKDIAYLPLLLILFLIHHQLFAFNRYNYGQQFAIIESNDTKPTYETIQSKHPYFLIWKLAQTVDVEKSKILFVYSYSHEDEIDPTSSIIYSLRYPDQDIRTFYHPEVELFLDYYFYPHKIDRIPAADLLPLSFKPGDILVSDLSPKDFARQKISIEGFSMEEYKELVPFNLNDYLRRSYFIYTYQ